MVRLKHSYVDDVRGTSSIGATNAQLSRLFSTCIREVVQLLSSLNNGAYMSATTLGTLLEVSYRVRALFTDPSVIVTNYKSAQLDALSKDSSLFPELKVYFLALRKRTRPCNFVCVPVKTLN